jgi:predicted CXXCH cytochrome family protein
MQPSAPPTGSHAEISCGECHKGPFAADCDACHEPQKNNPHPVGVVASMKVPPELPLGEGGKILCRTCHRIHGGNRADSYLRNGEDCFALRRTFCYRCHAEGMAGTNPHVAKKGSSRCFFCHVSDPSESKKPADTVRRPVNITCRFCHGTSEVGHAILLGATPAMREINGNRSGIKPAQPDCTTCHDPHGTAQTTHYLRPVFAETLVRVQDRNPHVPEFEACRSCHTTSFADEITAEDPKFLYGGNLIMLCLSCHTTERGHHPTGVRLTEAQALRVENSRLRLPLDRRGAITCATCHLSACASGSYAMEFRYYDRAGLNNDLCWACHAMEEFSEHDPHTDDPESCRWCHESRPIPGKRGQGGLLASPTMVCLQCHQVTPHPANKNHVDFAVPVAKVRLPLGEGGKVTCVTCHEPHHSGEFPRERLRSRSRNLCVSCHSSR